MSPTPNATLTPAVRIVQVHLQSGRCQVPAQLQGLPGEVKEAVKGGKSERPSVDRKGLSKPSKPKTHNQRSSYLVQGLALRGLLIRVTRGAGIALLRGGRGQFPSPRSSSSSTSSCAC